MVKFNSLIPFSVSIHPLFFNSFISEMFLCIFVKMKYITYKTSSPMRCYNYYQHWHEVALSWVLEDGLPRERPLETHRVTPCHNHHHCHRPCHNHHNCLNCLTLCPSLLPALFPSSVFPEWATVSILSSYPQYLLPGQFSDFPLIFNFPPLFPSACLPYSPQLSFLIDWLLARAFPFLTARHLLYSYSSSTLNSIVSHRSAIQCNTMYRCVDELYHVALCFSHQAIVDTSPLQCTN